MTKKRSPSVEWIAGFATTAVCLLIWELVGRSGLIEPAVYLPPASAVLEELFLIWGIVGESLMVTLLRSGIGLMLAILVGVPIGLAMGSLKPVRLALHPLVELLRPLPPIATVPVAIMFLGIFSKMKIAVIFFGCLWPIIVNSSDGVQHISDTLRDSARVMNLPLSKYFAHVILMGSLPFIITGIRISLAISLIVSVATEMIVGNDGIGFLLIDSERSFQFTRMYSSLVALMLSGFALNFVFTMASRRVLFYWRGTNDAEHAG